MILTKRSFTDEDEKLLQEWLCAELARILQNSINRNYSEAG